MSTDTIDTPHTSAILNYDVQLNETLDLLATMRNTIPYVPPATRLLTQVLVDATQEKHDAARAELSEVLKRVELVVRDECNKPNRILEESKAREIVEEDLAALGKVMVGLGVKADELERVRDDHLRVCAAEASAE